MERTFLNQVAQQLLEKGDGLNDYQLVFPQRRAIEVFRRLLGKKAPRMLTMSQLFIDYSGIRKADSSDMLFRLYNVYRSVCAERETKEVMTLDEFVPWSEMMLNDFDDVDKSLADAHSVFRELNNLKDIESIRFTDEQSLKSLKEYFSTFYQAFGTDMRGKFHEIWNMLSAIYDGVNALKEKTTYEGAVYRAGCGEILKSTDQKYAFIGFNVLCGAERRTMSWLKTQSRAEFFWDYTEGFVAEGNEAVENIRSNVKTYGGWTPPQYNCEQKPIYIIESPTQSGEAAFVEKWLGHVSPQKGDFTAVIPLDSNAKGMLCHFLPSEKYSFNISFPVSLSATYASLMRFSETELRRNINSPEYSCNDYLSSLNARLSEIVPEEDDEDYTLEKMSLDLARTAMETTQTLIDKNKGITVSPRVAAMIFKKKYANSEDEMPQQNSNPASGKLHVEVLDLADTRTIDYDNVILLDCNEGALPQGYRNPTMLPNVVRTAYGMPALSNRSGVAAYNFFRILKRTPNVAALFASSANAMGAKEMSRYLLQIIAGEVARDYEMKTIESPAIPKEYAPKAVVKTPGMLEKLTRLEPTPLYMYVVCPLKFYYNKIAGLRAPNPDPDKMPANLFGTIFHEAVQLYYEKKASPHIERSTIENDLNDKLHKNLNNCVDEAFKVCKVPDNSVIRGIIMRYFRDVLKFDSNRAPFDVVPQYIEKYIYTPFQTKSGYNVNVGGKFDRVHVKDGVYVVVDYKTGKWEKPVIAADFNTVISKCDNNQHYDYVLQTMVYSLALKDKLAADKTAYKAIRPELYFITGMSKPDFVPGVFVSADVVEDFARVESEVRTGIQALVDDIFDIEKPFAPCDDAKRCKYCDYKKLCNR